jgi:hypothetical protein
MQLPIDCALLAGMALLTFLEGASCLLLGSPCLRAGLPARLQACASNVTTIKAAFDSRASTEHLFELVGSDPYL